MNIIGQPDVYEYPLSKWFNQNLQPITKTPKLGETKVRWYQEAFDEKCGEFVTVEVWNGDTWSQRGLDVHMTVEDLDNLNRELGGEL
jgi:hypothetical protein